MSSIEMGSSYEAKEELGSIGIRAGICHGKDSFFSMFSYVQVLVSEFGTIDTLSSSSISNCEVTSLGHKAGDDTMEFGALEVERHALLTLSFLTRAEAAEVLSCLGSVLSVEGNFNSSRGLSTNGDVKEHYSHVVNLFAVI